MSNGAQIIIDFGNIPDIVLILINTSRAVFFIASVWLVYSFLTPKRPLWFQFLAFAAAWLTINVVRDPLAAIVPDHFWAGYTLSLIYLVPFTLNFSETFYAKMFVFFMVFSLSQCNFFICLYLDILVFKDMIGILLLSGLLLELACVPLITKYVRSHVRNILDVIDHQNHIFILLPILSFLLLPFYGAEKAYSLATFIPLVLFTLFILFSYYLIALSIYQTKHNQQLELASRTDSLTGLYNRRHMEQKIQEAYEQYQKNGSEFALIIADVDMFKMINDKYGHDCGDFLLKAIAEEIRKSVRDYDTVARWGGDEFLLLLPATNAKKATEFAERISKTVEKRRYVYENKVLAVTLTLGVSVIRSGDTVASIIKNADTVMYLGKRGGRNCVISFDSITNAKADIF